MPCKVPSPRTMPPATAPSKGKNCVVGKAISPVLVGKENSISFPADEQGRCRKVSRGEVRGCLLAEILRNNPLDIAHDRR